MWARREQLGKRIVTRALEPGGLVTLELEIPAVDAQSGDIYFEPMPGREAELSELGWLGAMTRRRCLLELYQRTPGPLQVRACVRKQLALDHSLAVDARRQKRQRPPLVWLWMISTGSPRTVLNGHGLAPVDGWPPGFWVRDPLDAMGLVVLSELPREPDTLLLRLLGRGRILDEAVADIRALPVDAREREIALPPLVALRFEVEQDPRPDAERRAFLMATQDLYEEWEQRVKSQGVTQGVKQGVKQGLVLSLASTYEQRFGTMPDPLRSALARVVSAESIGRWNVLFVTASAAEIAAAIRAGKPAR